MQYVHPYRCFERRSMFYQYGQKEIDYLKSRDKKLSEVINKIGIIERPIDEDIFTAIIRAILGQQVSRQARETVVKRLLLDMKAFTAENFLKLSKEELQSYGMTFRKAEYILTFCKQVETGKLDLEKLKELSDQEVIDTLSSIKGIGVWTAEMLLTSALQRQDIFSFGDLAIHRGLRMVYHHKEVTREMFERYRKRYSPYGTVASVYLWAVAAGAIPEMKDYKISRKGAKK